MNLEEKEECCMHEIYRNKAVRTSENGYVEYTLAIDTESKLYIEIINNPEGGKFKKGPLLFQTCEDIANGIEITGNNNNKTFYQAILNQLGINTKKDEK